MAQAERPLSAIDWLSQSVTTPVAASASHPGPGPTGPRPDEPPVASAGAALPSAVAVSDLDAPNIDGAGLLAPSVTGLPQHLWGMGHVAEIANSIATTDAGDLPALRALLMTLLLAEADPPVDSTGDGVLLLARVDRLLQMGALDQAGVLLANAGEPGAEMFRRSFDIALLTGNEDRACETLRSHPNLSPTFQARIFCLARSGDWNAAALSLRTGVALGRVTEDEEALIGRFLDPELYEGEPSPPVPSPVTPLAWRMFEAIGEPLPTSTLPIAFAHAELGKTAGWKAQLDAAERLERAGVVAPNLILGLYTERKAAASGGVWDRVMAFQSFDAALTAGDRDAVAQALPVVWARMVDAEIEVPFAMLYGSALAGLGLEGDARRIAFEVGLLSPDAAGIAENHRPADLHEAFLAGLARGNIDGLVPPDSMGRAIAPAFLTPDPGPELGALVEEERLGEAVLAAIGRISAALHGDQRGVAQGLSLLRQVGLERAARQAALELMLLERRG